MRDHDRPRPRSTGRLPLRPARSRSASPSTTSVAIGLVFGFLPARRAAQLDPIERAAGGVMRAFLDRHPPRDPRDHAQPAARGAHGARDPHRRRRGRHGHRARVGRARARLGSRSRRSGSNFIIVFPQSVQASGRARRPGARPAPHRGRRRARSLRESASVLAVAPVAARRRAGRLRRSELVDPGHRHDASPYPHGAQLDGRARGAAWDAHDEAAKTKVVRPRRDRRARTSSAPRTRSGARSASVATRTASSACSSRRGRRRSVAIRTTSSSCRSAACAPRMLHTRPGIRRGRSSSRRRRRRRRDRAVEQIDAILRQRHRIGRGRDARLRDAHAEGVPGDAGRRSTTCSPRCSSCIAGDQPPRRRHRRHEHHARQRHRADARDRDPHGHRRARGGHPACSSSSRRSSLALLGGIAGAVLGSVAIMGFRRDRSSGRWT